MDPSSPEVILLGSNEELKSANAHKIVATALYAGIPLIRKEGSSASSSLVSVSSFCPPPPSSSTLVLCYGDSNNNSSVRIGTTNAALRFLAQLAPTKSLLGKGPIEEAAVDGWLSFAWSSLDFPLQVLLSQQQEQQQPTNNIVNWDPSLKVLDQHLLYRTFLVGHALTVADIRMVVSLHVAVQNKIWDPSMPAEDGSDTATKQSYTNLARWYQTLTHQDWFRNSVKAMSSSSATGPLFASSAAASRGSGGGGVHMHGIATPVQSNKYRRQRIRIKEVLQDGGSNYLDQVITVAGWARTIRKASSKLFFVELNDGSVGQSLQCVLDIQMTKGFDDCKANGGTGASFSFLGKVVPSQGAEQAVDFQVHEATLLGAVYGGNVEGTEVGGMLYPMSKKEHTLEHMRDNAHLRPRGQIHAAAMRIRHQLAYATHNFFHNHGFLYIHTPIITGADCEGAGEQFGITTLLGNDHLQPNIQLPCHQPPKQEGEAGGGEEGGGEEKKISKQELKRQQKKKQQQAAKADPNKPEETIVIGAVDYTKDFFGQRVNLTVSGQLNVETHACALSDVYTFGPTFRAEESRTYRHLSEFWMIEPEIAFADLHMDINLAEDYLKYCVQYALENCADDLEFFEKNEHGEAGLRDRLRNVLENDFKRLTYTEAIEILKKAVDEDGVVFEVKPEWGIDLPSEHERYICEKVFGQPVVLMDYPKEIKAFYMKLNEDGKTVAAADILVPKIGEIIGGSQREHRLDVLKERCVAMNLDPRNVWWYLDLRRYGTVPHAGFGLGFERLILFITGLDNIRDVIPFPRWVGNAKF